MSDKPTDPTARDWPEDFDHENGNYQNRCTVCGHLFLGYKRRVVCKACSTADPTAIDPEDACASRKAMAKLIRFFTVAMDETRSDLAYKTLKAVDRILAAHAAAMAEIERLKMGRFSMNTDESGASTQVTINWLTLETDIIVNGKTTHLVPVAKQPPAVEPSKSVEEVAHLLARELVSVYITASGLGNVTLAETLIQRAIDDAVAKDREGRMP